MTEINIDLAGLALADLEAALDSLARDTTDALTWADIWFHLARIKRVVNKGVVNK